MWSVENLHLHRAGGSIALACMFPGPCVYKETTTLGENHFFLVMITFGGELSSNPIILEESCPAGTHEASHVTDLCQIWVERG